MALGELQAILEGLKTHQQRVLQQRQIALEGQRMAQEKSRSDEEIKLRRDQLAEQQRQFDIAQKAATAVHNLAIAQQMQDLTGKAMSGQPIPGATVEPVASGTGGAAYTPVNPLAATAQRITMPPEVNYSGAQQPLTVTTPTPVEAAKQQAQLSEITQEPTNKARMALVEAQKQADFLRTMAQQVAQAQRDQEKMKAQQAIASAHDATNLARARIMATSKQQLSPEWQNYDLSPYVKSAIDGSMTHEDLQKLVIPKPLKESIEKGVKDSGAMFMQNKDKDFINAFGPIVDTVNLMDQFIQQQPQTSSFIGSKLGGVASFADNDLNNISDQIGARLTGIARTMGKETGRLSNWDEQRARGYVPSRFMPVDKNIERRNNFVKSVRNDLVKKLKNSGMADAQVSAVLDRNGLNDIKPLIPGGAPAAQAPAQATPAAQPQRPSLMQLWQMNQQGGGNQ